MFNILTYSLRWLILCLMHVPISAEASPFPPSFDCTKNKKNHSTEEKLICTANERWRLGVLDFLIHEKYNFLMTVLPEKEANALKKEQRQWLDQRTLCHIKKELGGKIMFTNNEAYLEKYLEMRHDQLTEKVMALTQSDLSSVEKKTEIANQKMAGNLLGKRKLELQWLSFDNPAGYVLVSNKDGVYTLKGEQIGSHHSYLKMDGWVSHIDENYFIFVGEIATRGYNMDKECVRKGRFTFAVTKNRPYWRLQEMYNACQDQTDYVDIYFAEAKE